MKLSAYMKTEMEYVSDKYLLEAADTGKNFRAAPMYILPSNESSPIDKLKKIASVAACVILAVAVIVAFILMRNSISPGGDDPADSETDTGTGTETETELTDEEKEAISKALLALYERGPEGGTVINDNKVYRSIGYNDTEWSYSEFGNEGFYKFKYRDYDTRYNLCEKSECTHDDVLICPAITPARGGIGIVIDSEDREAPIAYSIGNYPKTIVSNGVEADVPKYTSRSDVPQYIIFEHDFAKGTRRAVAVDIPIILLDSASQFYCNGKIYCYSYDSNSHNGLFETDAECVTLVIDVITGEYECFEWDCDVVPCGVYDEKIYLLSENGEIIACDEELKNPEMVADVGALYPDPQGRSPWAYMIGSRIYFEKNTEDIKISAESEDGKEAILANAVVRELYSFDVTSENDPVLITDSACMWYPDYVTNSVYYTELDYKFYGYYEVNGISIPIDTDNSGSLYRYDPEAGETACVFEDCGGDVANICKITDDYIFFSGVYYKGLEEGYEYGDTVNASSVFMYDRTTQELTVLFDNER